MTSLLNVEWSILGDMILYACTMFLVPFIGLSAFRKVLLSSLCIIKSRCVGWSSGEKEFWHLFYKNLYPNIYSLCNIWFVIETSGGCSTNILITLLQRLSIAEQRGIAFSVLGTVILLPLKTLSGWMILLVVTHIVSRWILYCVMCVWVVNVQLACNNFLV